MKKRIFSTIAVFAALVLTACGAKPATSGDESQPAGESQPSAAQTTSAKHEHTFDTTKWESDATNHWHPATCEHTSQKGDKAAHTLEAFNDATHVDKAATCKEEGVKYEKCSVCGYIKETKVAKLDHTWGEWVNDATAKCGEAGSRTRTCSICGETETETLGMIPHDWDLEHATTVEASNGGVEYTIAKCKKCNADGYFVAAAKATLSSGASKKTAPEGCVKMSPDGATMTVSFNLDAAKTGTFFLRGAMDYWYEDSNNNQNKTYYSANNGHTDAATKTGNFKLEVGPDADHLTNVELPDNTDLKFADMLPETVASTEGGHNWSVIGDCIVGQASLAAGLNMIKFTRVDSYNLAVHDFLFVVPAAA